MLMKKILFLLLPMALMLAGCEDLNKQISCDPDFKIVAATGGEFTVTVTSKSAWTATVNQSWVVISPNSGQGDAYVNIIVAAGENGIANVLFTNGESTAILVITREEGVTPHDSTICMLPGEFSVSETKKVHFSKGNLQATTTDLGANWTWAFAEHQWDYIGDAAANNAINGNGIVTANGTVDLFGWSTATTYYGISNSLTNISVYLGSFVDWSATIGDGWHTSSIDEWVYLFYGRTDAAHLFGMGSVNGVNGTILLPDNWAGDKFRDTENGLADQVDFYYNENGTNFSFHTYTAEQWDTMEKAGAVFLPAAGFRRKGVSWVGSEGKYWSSSPDDLYETYAHDVYFDSLRLIPRSYGGLRLDGHSVRLVR